MARAAAALRRNPLGFLERVAAEQGDVARFPVGRTSALLLSNPEHVQTLLASRHRDFAKANTLDASGRAPREPAPEGVLTTGDPVRHVHGRRLAHPPFARSSVAGYEAYVRAHAARVTEGWHRGATVDLGAAMAELAAGVLVDAVFPTDRVEPAAVAPAMTEFLESFRFVTSRTREAAALVRVPSFARAVRAFGALRGASARIVRAAGDGSVVALLGADAGATLDRLERDVLGLLLAGTATTASALTWTFLFLAERPEWERRVAAGDEAAARAVLAETLRLRPPSWYIGRRALVDVEVDGIGVAAGTVVLACPYLLHRDARSFPAPLEFRPERWLEGLDPVTAPGYLPFGAGPRRCLGEALAWLEGTIVPAAVLGGRRVVPLARHAPEAVATIRPRGRVLARIEARDA